MERGYGYQFVTWSRDQDRRRLSHGHYYLNGYKQAKEDFAVRAGLVPKELLVSRRPPETPDPVRGRDPEEYGKNPLTGRASYSVSKVMQPLLCRDF